MLTVVDSCTRWPWVFLLKSLGAKVVCEVLLNLFSQVGISSVKISDNGTNFMSQLTQQFMKLFGCVVTVSSSDYVNWLCSYDVGLCVWAEFIMLATNRTEAVVNESCVELHMYKGVELRSWSESDV